MKKLFAKKMVRRILGGAFILSLLAGPAKGQIFERENIHLGKAAPNFTVTTTQGKPINMTKFRDGKSAIIFFWATWCPHCRVALRELNGRTEEFAQKDIKLIAVVLGEDLYQVRDYTERNKINIEIFLDEDSLVAERYNIIGVPTLFFVNAQGIVKAVEHFLPGNYEEILGLSKTRKSAASK